MVWIYGLGCISGAFMSGKSTTMFGCVYSSVVYF